MQNILKKVIDYTFNLNVGIINGTVSNTTSHSSTSKSARYRILDNFESKEDVLYALLEHTICDLDYYHMDIDYTKTHTFQ